MVAFVRHLMVQRKTCPERSWRLCGLHRASASWDLVRSTADKLWELENALAEANRVSTLLVIILESNVQREKERHVG